MYEPSWLDATFVEKVLRKTDSDESIEVSNVIVRPATNDGDNYSSDIRRISMELSRIQNGDKIIENRSIIAKLELEGDVFDEMVTGHEKLLNSVGGTELPDIVLNNGLFEREMSMMMEILPIMNGMLAKYSTTLLSARCLQVQYETPLYLIIEDLAPRGFQLADVRVNLNLDHCMLAMQNLAAFHAASVALAEKDPKAVRKYKRSSHFGKSTTTFEEFINGSVKALGEEVAQWPELNPRISEKLLKLAGFILEKESEACIFLEDDFNVLNHGDCWRKNMLFRYNEEGKPIEQIFVDFQLCRYGSPAIDILNFLALSPTVEIGLHDRELLVRVYHESLTRNMTNLKCTTEAPSIGNLQDVLKRRAFYEVTRSLIPLAYALAERIQDNNEGELLTPSEHPDYVIYRSESYRNVMTRVLPFFDNMGLLDL